MAKSELDRAAPPRTSEQPLLRVLPRLYAEDDTGPRSAPTVPEIYGALKAMKTGVALRPAGLTAEFYRTYWDAVGLPLCAVVREFFMSDGLPSSLRAGRIILLPKDGGDRADTRSWRPINLA